jgi:hypothetical protein
MIILLEKFCGKCGSLIEQKNYLLKECLCRKCYNDVRRMGSIVYYNAHRDTVLERIKNYKTKNKEKIRIQGKIYRENVKLKILVYYSKTDPPQCADPHHTHDVPFTDIRALTIDHINGGGSEHRREMRKKGNTFYNWLKKNYYPNGYQCLCVNCQFIKEAELKGHTSQLLKDNNLIW